MKYAFILLIFVSLAACNEKQQVIQPLSEADQIQKLYEDPLYQEYVGLRYAIQIGNTTMKYDYGKFMEEVPNASDIGSEYCELSDNEKPKLEFNMNLFYDLSCDANATGKRMYAKHTFLSDLSPERQAEIIFTKDYRDGTLEAAVKAAQEQILKNKGI